MKTFKNYSEYAEHPISEKITLAHVSCKQRCYGFTNVSGDIYSATAPLFVVACHKGTSSLTEVSSSGDVTASSYYFDSLTSKIYVHSSNGFIDEDTDPEIIPTYRMFFSSAPINLSYDLTNNLATQVYYEPRIKDSPGFSSKLDNDKTGISVTGSGTLTLDNGDLFFKQYYDLFIFENQEIKIYSYHRSLDVNQSKILYSGNITDKTYGNKNVTFKVKDDINKLKEAISLGKLSDITDTINVSEEVGTYFKRRIYGTLSKLKVQSVDMLWDNTTEDETFTLGLVSGQIGSKKLTGTNFISLICSGDKIVVGNQEMTVETVYNDTTMIVSEELEVNYVNAVAKVSPDVSFYNKNRKFLVCGHSLQDVVTTVTDVIERNRISVASTTGLRVGDYVQIADQYISIKRISGLKLILNQNLAVVPPIGTEVRKMQVQKVQVRYPDDLSKKTIVLNKEDYSLSTTSEGTYLNITDKAEVNATLPKTIQGNYYTIFGFDMVWLGIPTMFRVDTVANVSDSLVGKYFSLYSDRSEVVFWFSKKVDSDYDQTEPPEFYVDISPSNIDVSGNRININAHGLTEGQNVSFSAPTGSLPGGIVENYNYFVRDVETNYFKISADANSEIRDITSSGSGSIHVILSKNMFEISLPSPNLTANQVADLVAESIPTSLSTYLTQVDLNKVTVYSKSGRDLQAGVAGTSGFSVIKLIKGQQSDQAINLQKLIKTRDYIKMSGESDSRYVEVLDVYSDSLRVREQMSIGGTNKLHVKNVGYVDNNSYIYVDCFGKVDTNGELIVDAASVVKDLLYDSGLSGRIDSQSFIDSSQAIPYMMSLKIPYAIADSETTLKDVIDDINKTVLGSLVLTDTLQLAYNVIDAERLAEDLDVITDSDRLSWSIKSTGSNYKYIVSHYDFSDIDSETSTEYVYTSDFSEKYTKSEIFLDIDLHLKNKDEAEEASQRRLFYNTLSRADITIKGDLNLAKYNMGDKVIINFRDLYLRLGNNSSNRIICSVSSVKRTGEEVELIVTTQGGNIYSRNALISQDYSPSFDNASEDEKLFSSYITENNGTINNDNSLVGCNSIA